VTTLISIRAAAAARLFPLRTTSIDGNGCFHERGQCHQRHQCHRAQLDALADLGDALGAAVETPADTL
jgi:hypothetical protein